MNIIELKKFKKYLKRNIVAVIATFLFLIIGNSAVLGGGGGNDPCADGFPNASFTVLPTNKSVGSLDANFDGSYSIACDDPIVSYEWNFGDGNVASGQIVSHQYSIGTYIPSLTITDAAGLKHTNYYYSNINVKSDNQSPIFTDDNRSVLQGESTVINLAASAHDPDGDDISNNFFLPGNEEYGTNLSTDKGYVYLTSSTGEFTYTAQDYVSGIDTFDVAVRDGYGGIGIATVTINIDEHVTAIDDHASTVENQSVSINVMANDTSYQGEPFEVYWSSFSSAGSVVINEDGSVTFAPNTGFVGTASFEYRIKSSIPNTWRTSGAFVFIDVEPAPEPPNRPPVANNDTLSIDEDTIGAVNLLDNDSDADNDPMTVEILNSTANGISSMGSNGELTYAPDENFFGTDQLDYRLHDDVGNYSNVASLYIYVASVNDLPVAVDDSVIVDEDSLVAINVLSNDTDIEDGNNLTVDISTQPQHGTVAVNSDGTVTYVPYDNYFGSDSFVYSIADNSGGLASASVTISVVSVNDAPIAIFSHTISKSGSADFYASASSDIDGTISSYRWDFGDGTQISSTSDTVSYKYRSKGNFTVTLTVTDDQGASSVYSSVVSR
jgi:large repetitive protein